MRFSKSDVRWGTDPPAQLSSSMNASFQTIAALVIVAIAVMALTRRALAKRRNPGCGSDCGAVSPEIKRLQARLKARR